MKKIGSFSLIWVVLLTIACNQDDTVDVKPPTPKQGENFKFFTSAEMYNDALGKRSGDYSAPFEIINVAAQGVKGKIKSARSNCIKLKWLFK